uniref:Uncharacterized protein LOC108040170 n=1 Tax=Drosophila rhopaloa TaxID=1041015 RepID=A0A6P4ECS4_DRORH
MTSMDPGEEEEIPIEDANDQRSSKRTSSVQRNSKDVNGRRSSKRRSPRLRSFAAENPFEILIVRARNAKGKASQPFVGNRHVKEVYKIKEITSKNKIEEENTIKEMDRTNSYIRGRSNWTSYQQGPTSRIVEEESVEIAPKIISKSPIAKDHIKEIYKVQEEPQYLKKGSFKEEEDITATKSISNSTIDKDSSKKMHKVRKRSSKINEQQENLFAKSNHKFSKAKHHKNEIVRIRRAKEEPADLTPKLNLKSPIAKPPYPTKEIYKVHERSQNQKINQRNLKGEPTKSKPNSAIGQNPTSKTHKVRKKSNKLSEQQVNSNAKLNHKSLKAKHPRNNIHDYHAESEKPNEEENKTFEEKENITKSNTKVPIFQTLLKTISKVQNRSKSKKQANSVEEKGYGFPKRDNESFIYQYQKRSRNMNEQNGIDEGDLLLAAPSFANSYYDSTDQEKNYNNEPEKKL